MDFLGDEFFQKNPVIYEQTSKNYDEKWTLISGTFPDNPLIEKMNSFHDQLTEHLIKDKELSFVQGIFSDNCLVQLK